MRCDMPCRLSGVTCVTLNDISSTPMANLYWYLPLEQCRSLDEVRHQWHALLESNRVAPYNPAPGYEDAMLAFLGACKLAPPIKLGAMLALGSSFDIDLRLALGALSDAVLAWEAPWPDSVSGAVQDLGPALQVDSSDAWLAAFVAGRLAGVRETLSHDGTRIDDWKAAFWNRFLDMAARHASSEHVHLALQQGASISAANYAAVAAAAQGMHLDNTIFSDYDLPDPGNAPYQQVLQLLLEAGLARQAMLEVALPAAASVDNTDMLDFLLMQGADIAQDGGAALVAAARNMAYGACAWLLEHGADIHHDNGAVLNAAVATLDETMIETMLDAGAAANGPAIIDTALQSRPWDLYSIETEFDPWRANIIALLMQRGALAQQDPYFEQLRANSQYASVLDQALHLLRQPKQDA